VMFVERGKICSCGYVVVKRLLEVFRVKGRTSACEMYVFWKVKCWEAESCLEAEQTRRRRCTPTPP
jgi:hypothetical protein